MTTIEGFWERVDKTGGCWLWTGPASREGYGSVTIQGKHWRVHRLSYQLAGGVLIDGMEIDHLCFVPRCVNPAHLEQVTGRENNLRSSSPSAVNARRTHCKKGHEFTPENTRWRRDRYGRECKTCELAHGYENNARRRAITAAKRQEKNCA